MSSAVSITNVAVSKPFFVFLTFIFQKPPLFSPNIGVQKIEFQKYHLRQSNFYTKVFVFLLGIRSLLTSVVEALRSQSRFQSCRSDYERSHDDLVNFSDDLYIGYDYTKQNTPNENIRQRGSAFGALTRQLTCDRARFIHDLVTSAGGTCGVDIKPSFRHIWVPNTLDFDADESKDESTSTGARDLYDLSFNQDDNPNHIPTLDAVSATNATNAARSNPTTTTNHAAATSTIRHLGARRISELSNPHGNQPIYSGEDLENDTVETAIRRSLRDGSDDSHSSISSQLKRKASTPNSNSPSDRRPNKLRHTVPAAVESFETPCASMPVANRRLSSGRTHSMAPLTFSEVIEESVTLETRPVPQLDPNGRTPRQLVNVFNHMHPHLPNHPDSVTKPGLGDHGVNVEPNHMLITQQLG